MINSRFVLLSVIGGIAVATWTLVVRKRQLATQQLKEDVRAWEDEGGNLAPAVPAVRLEPAVVPPTSPA
jgi:hypothetical protein